MAKCGERDNPIAGGKLIGIISVEYNLWNSIKYKNAQAVYTSNSTSINLP